jgi:hypothetical protein
MVRLPGGEVLSVPRHTDTRGAEVLITASALAYGAERMSEPAYDRAGALGPAAAFDPRELLGALGAFDVRLEAPAT